MADFLELDSEDSGVYEISEGVGEYFVKGAVRRRIRGVLLGRMLW